jgi:hypothetical protein
MARAIALARTTTAATDIAPILRVIVVTGCALALVLAGQPLPF